MQCRDFIWGIIWCQLSMAFCINLCKNKLELWGLVHKILSFHIWDCISNLIWRTWWDMPNCLKTIWVASELWYVKAHRHWRHFSLLFCFSAFSLQITAYCIQAPYTDIARKTQAQIFLLWWKMTFIQCLVVLLLLLGYQYVTRCRYASKVYGTGPTLL